MTTVLNQPRGGRVVPSPRVRHFRMLHRQTPDLMGTLKDAERGQGDPVGFNAVFAWARAQDFDADHAERMRRDAWDRSE